MSSKKRVFATNNIVNYNDLYQLKNGCEILKTVKNNDNNAILKQFINYKQWQTLNKAYFTFIDNDAIEVNRVRDLYNSNNSYSNNDCDNEYYSNCNNDCNNGCNCSKKCNNECNNELYLRGKIIIKKNIAQQFPSNIVICKWCNNNNKIKSEDIMHHHLKKNITQQFPSNIVICKCCNNNNKIKKEDITHHDFKKNKIQEFFKSNCDYKCNKNIDNLKYSNCSLCKNAKQLFI